jgi:uncharacterized membrane protein
MNNKNGKLSKREQLDKNDTFWIKPERLVALTDGVFAITMTLLVLELHPFDIIDHFNTDGWLEIYVYFIGFLSLGVYWTLHHYIFHFIKRANGALLWWNIAFLALSSLVPFWTRVISPPEGVDTHFLAPFLYGLFMIFTFIVLYIIWYNATTNNFLVARNFDPQITKSFNKTLLYGCVMVGIISAIATVIPLLGWLLLAIGGYFIYVTVYGPHKVFK